MSEDSEERVITMTQFETVVESFRTDLKKVSEVLGGQISGLQADMSMVKTEIAALHEEHTLFRMGQARLEAGQARLEKDVSILKTDVSELKKDVKEIKIELKTKVSISECRKKTKCVH